MMVISPVRHTHMADWTDYHHGVNAFGLPGSPRVSRCQGQWFDPWAGQFQHCYTG